MAYTPTNWVDGATPVNAANLNKLEQGLDAADQAASDATALAQAAQPEAEKGQVNGYASLDAAGKVPLAQLPPVGADLSYDGDWAAPTTYQDGDVVVKDGVAYLCVGGPTTVAPDPAPWGAAALAKVAYGTTLPASPVDGQEAILVDSLTNPTYQWRFRYNAGSTSPYKWEFVGGTGFRAVVEADETWTTTDTWLDLATVGPAILVPRAGDYEAHFGVNMYHSAANAALLSGLSISATSPLNSSGRQAGGMVPAATTGIDVGNEAVFPALVANDQIRIRYYTGAAGTAHARWRWLSVWPRRVG